MLIWKYIVVLGKILQLIHGNTYVIHVVKGSLLQNIPKLQDQKYAQCRNAILGVSLTEVSGRFTWYMIPVCMIIKRINP